MTSTSFSFAPTILISAPSLLDPNFFRTLVLVFQHDSEGAAGLVLNRPTQYPAVEVTKSLGIEWQPASEQKVGVGGPVEPQSLWFLHSADEMFDESLPIGSELAVSRSENALKSLCELNDPYLSLFVGYAGWGAGQLEDEVRRGDWLLSELDMNLMFDIEATRKWTNAFEKIGIDPVYFVSSGGSVQ